ncbi:MAG TPA: nucleotidyltransferase family protein [Pyrinomonadaceae bacterium]
MSVAAIILAAGQSSRMGAFKPLLPWGTQTVIESCINYLHKGGADQIVVVVGHRADEIRQHLSSTSVTFAVNPDPRSEMTESIKRAVIQISDDVAATLITPVDYPAVSPETVASVIAEWSKGNRLIKPTYQDRGGHPVLIDMSYRKELLSLSPTAGLKSLFDAHRNDVKRVEVECSYIARDIDTWDDYHALYVEIFGAEPPGRSNVYSNENPKSLI